MPVRFAIDRTMRLVVYVVEGDATAAEASDFLDAVLAHPDFERGFNFLGDRRGVDRAPSSAYVRSVADAVKARSESLGPCSWAVVVGSDSGYGMARMWGILTDASAVEIVPFRTPEAASTWLGLPQTCPPLSLIPAA
jgi:hypothetical protein